MRKVGLLKCCNALLTRFQCLSSCFRSIQPDLCVCDCNLRETQLRQCHFFSWSVFHDPLFRCTCKDFFRFFLIRESCLLLRTGSSGKRKRCCGAESCAQHTFGSRNLPTRWAACWRSAQLKRAPAGAHLLHPQRLCAGQTAIYGQLTAHGRWTPMRDVGGYVRTLIQAALWARRQGRKMRVWKR